MSDVQVLLPDGWKRPRGWSNGILSGDQLHIAGQFGWDPAKQTFPSVDFGGQWRRALENLLEVVATAGGRVEDVSSLRIYVTDLDDYRNAAAAVAEGWQATFGSHFPAITMLQVAGFTEHEAVIEIEGTARL